MTEQRRPIFRAEAVRRYVEGQRRMAFPRFVCPRIFLYLWIALAGLLLAAAVTTWYVGRSISAERSHARVAYPKPAVDSYLKSPASRMGERQ